MEVLDRAAVVVMNEVAASTFEAVDATAVGVEAPVNGAGVAREVEHVVAGSDGT